MRLKPKYALYGFELVLGIVIVTWWFLRQERGHQEINHLPVEAVNDPELAPRMPNVAPTNKAPAPILPTEQLELHGRFNDQPFWLRVLTDDPAKGGRIMQLVYTPPARGEIDDTVLIDCPFLLLDAHAGILAWNGRGGLSEITREPDKSYKIVREIQVGEGDASLTDSKMRTTIPIEPLWDLRLAPIMLALTWKPDTSARMRLMDFFGPRIKEDLYLEWVGTDVTLAGVKYTVSTDDQRHFQALNDGQARALVIIEGR
jgi:hypothetical protein